MVQTKLRRERVAARRMWSASGMLVLSLLALSGFNSVRAQVALTAAPAGSAIGNQAAATYTDGSGTSRTATSNAVTTLVQQVGSFTLTQDNTKPGAAGTTVYFPHTVTNTGNGTDSFNLPAPTVASGNFVPTGIAVYADSNGDGVPDNFTPITATPNLLPGETFNFVVSAAIPGATPDTGTATLNVDATSVFNGAPPTNDPNGNDDVVTVTSNAVIEITKAISANNGPSLAVGDPAVDGVFTYTLTYRNNGRVAATNVAITDVLDSRLGYVANSGTWTGGAPVTDAAGGDAAGLNYTSAAGTISAVIASVAPRQTGQITFQVTLDRGLSAPQIVPNTATYTYDSDNNGSSDGTGTTNTVNLNVTPIADVVGLSPAAVPSATQGSTIPFSNTFTNTGSGNDVFDITLSPGSYPAGTTFALFKSDGATPLIDTNGNGIPDTGTVAAGASYVVVLQVTLPAGIPAVPGPYSVVKTATSTIDPTQTATTTDTLTTIATSLVDLTDPSAPGGANGTGPGPEAIAVTALSGNPGTTVRYSLTATNPAAPGARTDNYDLSVSTLLGNPLGGTPGLTVVFRNAAGGVITNTGDVLPGASFDYFADVTIPAGAAPTVAPTDLYFQILSPVSGASDRLHDTLEINTVRAITVEPNNTGQAYPGNTVVYTHTVSNNGNVTETGITLGVADANAAGGFASTLYVDTNNNGILDAGDLPVTSIASLPAGTSVTVFVSTFTPGSATPGQQNIATVTATSTGATLPGGGPAPGANPSDTATDTTTVVAGQLELVKEQAIDANGDGTPDTPFSTTPIAAGAIPGACIRYRIRVTNIGTADVNTVVVSDSTPAFTVYDNGTGADVATGIGNAVWVNSTGVATGAVAPLVDGNAGSLSFNVGTLTPGQSATIYFGVRINQ